MSAHLDQINKYAMVINNLSNENFKIHSFYGYIIGENIEYDFIEERNSSFKQSPNLKFIFRPSYDIPGKFGREKGDLYTDEAEKAWMLYSCGASGRINAWGML